MVLIVQAYQTSQYAAFFWASGAALLQEVQTVKRMTNQPVL
jgi:hypothetical protein